MNTPTWSLEHDFPPHAEPQPKKVAGLKEWNSRKDLMVRFGYVRYPVAAVGGEPSTPKLVGPQGVVYVWDPLPSHATPRVKVSAYSIRRQEIVMEVRTFAPDERDEALAYARGLAVEILAEMERCGPPAAQGVIRE